MSSSALQLSAYSDYSSLSRYSHRRGADLGQVMYAVHMCETKCLLSPGQAVGQAVQCVIGHICIARASRRLCAQVVQETSPRLAHPPWKSVGVISSDGCPLSHDTFSRTSVRGRVCISRFGKRKVNIKDNASHGQVCSSGEWLFW